MKKIEIVSQLTRDTLWPLFDIARKHSLVLSNFDFDPDEEDIITFDLYLPDALTREEWHASLREFQLDELADFSDKLFGELEGELF